MSAETVPVQDAKVEEEVLDAPISTDAPEQPEIEAPVQEAPPKEEHVPLSALQKERRKRQEAEQELKWHREQMMQKKASEESPEPDESHLEPATRAELNKAEQKILRQVDERNWLRQNPEKAQEINEKLTEFLKQRPNLAPAIEAAQNRYEEAWTLMDALTPKQKIALKQSAPKREAPGNPSSVPKAAAMDQSLNLMAMSDTEFNAWRKSQKRR